MKMKACFFVPKVVLRTASLIAIGASLRIAEFRGIGLFNDRCCIWVRSTTVKREPGARPLMCSSMERISQSPLHFFRKIERRRRFRAKWFKSGSVRSSSVILVNGARAGWRLSCGMSCAWIITGRICCAPAARGLAGYTSGRPWGAHA